MSPQKNEPKHKVVLPISRYDVDVIFKDEKKTQPNLKIFFTLLKTISKPSHLWVKWYFSKLIKFYKKKCQFFGKTSDKILTFFCVKIYVVFEKVISPIVQKCSQNKTWTFSQKMTKFCLRFFQKMSTFFCKILSVLKSIILPISERI